MLPILDRYVLSCLIASTAALNRELSHDQALFPLLKTLAQTIVNIINPQTSLNTRPVLPKEIYQVEFWHAHLNYACHRASDAGLPGGGAARLAGDQICHWNTLSPASIFQATHLIVFLPPCLGAFVLANHSSDNPAFFKHPPADINTTEGPTACVKQVANYPLPSLLPNQADTMRSARSAAATGQLSSYTIPLLAEPETLKQTARLNWVLRFPLPPPSPHSNRRFSFTPSYNHGPRTPHALEAAIRFAAPFTYDNPPATHPFTASFMQLPDPVTRFGPVHHPTPTQLHPPPSDIQEWLHAGAVRIHSQDEYQVFGANNFFGHINIDQLITLLDTAPLDPTALQTAVQNYRASKRAKVDILCPLPRQHPPYGPLRSLFLQQYLSLPPFPPAPLLLILLLKLCPLLRMSRIHLLEVVLHVEILTHSSPSLSQTLLARGNLRLVLNPLVRQVQPLYAHLLLDNIPLTLPLRTCETSGPLIHQIQT